MLLADEVSSPKQGDDESEETPSSGEKRGRGRPRKKPLKKDNEESSVEEKPQPSQSSASTRPEDHQIEASEEQLFGDMSDDDKDDNDDEPVKGQVKKKLNIVESSSEEEETETEEQPMTHGQKLSDILNKSRAARRDAYFQRMENKDKIREELAKKSDKGPIAGNLLGNIMSAEGSVLQKKVTHIEFLRQLC